MHNIDWCDVLVFMTFFVKMPEVVEWDCFFVKLTTLAAEKIGDSPIKSDMKLGPQTHLGAESQS